MFKFFNPIYPKEVKKIDYINRINDDIKKIIENAGGKLDKDGNLIKNGDINNEDYLNLLALFHMQIPYDKILIYGFDYNNADVYDMIKILDIIAKVPPVYKPVLISYFGIGVDRIPFNEVDTDKFWEAFSWVPKEDRSVLEKYYGEEYGTHGIKRNNQKSYYSTSIYSRMYFIYVKHCFFRGLTPEEFEKDEKIMEEFNKVKAEIKYEHIASEYENLPTRERKSKPKDNLSFTHKNQISFKTKKDNITDNSTDTEELSEEAKLWRDMIVHILRNISKSKIKRFVNDENTIIGIAKYEKDLILKSAAYELIYEDEEKYKEKLSYIINR